MTHQLQLTAPGGSWRRKKSEYGGKIPVSNYANQSSTKQNFFCGRKKEPIWKSGGLL